VIGRLDHLIEAVYERFKDRYFLDESELSWFTSLRPSDHRFKGCLSIFKERGTPNLSRTLTIRLTFSRYYARVMQVFPPRSSLVATTPPSLPSKPDEEDQIHKLASDLKLPVKDANVRDDPQKYLYKIQIHEDNKEKGHC
jgi:bromodomain adjacent to zinc finger domain protein 1A